ncbi:hypothetical protein AN963_18985 [Brevibacillus choshinensis]|uniref:Uncharacterized protein n=1 Tax=Brevibacillus choshinensis TaxID=54911 RepID=A0ABR5N8J5_BRECH|nr:hypothetical protein AN963_18985 [Brevibacillus choshinensis]
MIYILAYDFPVVNHPVQREIAAFIDREEGKVEVKSWKNIPFLQKVMTYDYLYFVRKEEDFLAVEITWLFGTVHTGRSPRMIHE